MKFYLSLELLETLIFAEKEKRKELSLELQDFLKKDSRFFTSTYTVSQLFSKNEDFSEPIFLELSTLCEEILSVTQEDLKLALALKKNYNFHYSESLDLAIAIRTCDVVLVTNEKLNSQKLIRFIRLGSKSKVNRL